MGEVTISVGGRAYQVICEDGEEDRLTAIAARVDKEASVFGNAGPTMTEARLLLMSSLLLADKLDDAEKAVAAAANAAPPPPAPVVAAPAPSEAADPALAAAVAAAADRRPAKPRPHERRFAAWADDDRRRVAGRRGADKAVADAAARVEIIDEEICRLE